MVELCIPAGIKQESLNIGILLNNATEKFEILLKKQCISVAEYQIEIDVRPDYFHGLYLFGRNGH